MNFNPEEETQIQGLIASYRPGRSLVREFYSAPEIYARDLERVFLRQWLFAGHAGRVPNAGDYFLHAVAGESVILIRDRSGVVNALVNVCPHRGSRVCLEETGHVSRLVCPYHAWCFELDGTLLNARQLPSETDVAGLGMRRLAVREVEGLIFFCFADSPPDFSGIADDLGKFFGPHELARARIADRTRMLLRANWKIVAENFFECYHCLPSHPELTHVMSYVHAFDSPRLAAERAAYTVKWEERAKALGHVTGMSKREDGAHVAACRIPIREGFKTQSREGRPVAPLMGKFKEYDGGVTAMQFFPIHWFVADNDYGMLVRFTPIAVQETEIEVTWLVAENAVEGKDYRLDELTWLWGNTLREDQTITENNQAGVNSRFYEPGPHGKEEKLDEFLQWYLEQIR